MVDAGGSRQAAFLDICGWIPFARALRPFLVALNTLERASASRAGWAAVYGKRLVTALLVSCDGPSAVNK
jgi:hypothetical protein